MGRVCFSMTMYDKRPTRWRDAPRDRDDVFLPLLTPWPGFERSVATIQRAYRDLSPSWDEPTEQKIFQIMLAVFSHLKHDAAELSAIKPTVPEFLARAANHTFAVSAYDPGWPLYSRDEVLDFIRRARAIRRPPPPASGSPADGAPGRGVPTRGGAWPVLGSAQDGV